MRKQCRNDAGNARCSVVEALPYLEKANLLITSRIQERFEKEMKLSKSNVLVLFFNCQTRNSNFRSIVNALRFPRYDLKRHV